MQSINCGIFERHVSKSKRLETLVHQVNSLRKKIGHFLGEPFKVLNLAAGRNEAVNYGGNK